MRFAAIGAHQPNLVAARNGKVTPHHGNPFTIGRPGSENILEAEVRAAQKAARTTIAFDEQVAAKRHYEGLKRQLDAARRNQYDEIERLEAEADKVTTEMQRALRERTVTEMAIATIRWRLVSPTTPEP